MICVVTGASRGIGLGITKALLSKGMTVVGTARNESEEIKALAAQNADRFFFVPCDISSQDDRKALCGFVTDNFGRVDLLVNNAGVAPKVRKNILEISEDDFDYLTDINLKGTYFVTQLFANVMKKQGGGRIINISSVSADTASVNRGEYCISKAGISMITKLFAAEMSQYGVGVFEIRPGIIETDMTAAVHEKYERMIENGLTLIKRFGTPDDVAGCVVAVAEGLLDFCQGQVLNADGGFHISRL